jgi:hypothetical protein
MGESRESVVVENGTSRRVEMHPKAVLALSPSDPYEVISEVERLRRAVVEAAQGLVIKLHQSSDDWPCNSLCLALARLAALTSEQKP